MNEQYKKKLKEAFDSLKELESLLDDRIVENNSAVGVMTKQATHCYVLYRKLLWEAKYNIRDILNKEGGNLIG